MNRADVAMLNQSLDRLGDTMFRNRMLRRQEEDQQSAVTRDESRYADTLGDRERTFKAGREDRAADVKYREGRSQAEDDYRKTMLTRDMMKTRQTEYDRVAQQEKIDKALESQEAQKAIAELDKAFATFDKMNAGATDDEYAVKAKAQVKSLKDIYEKFLGRSAWGQFLNENATVKREKKEVKDPTATEQVTEETLSPINDSTGKPQLDPITQMPMYNKRSVRRTVPATPAGGTAAPKGGSTPQAKAALANKLAAQHPDWPREKIIAEVNKQLP